jgi:hypothetical protein
LNRVHTMLSILFFRFEPHLRAGNPICTRNSLHNLAQAPLECFKGGGNLTAITKLAIGDSFYTTVVFLHHIDLEILDLIVQIVDL